MGKKIPIIKALPRTDEAEGFMFWCPFCEEWHRHGIREGHRVAHCSNMKSPFRETGYIIRSLNNAETEDLLETLHPNMPKCPHCNGILEQVSTSPIHFVVGSGRLKCVICEKEYLIAEKE